MDDMLNDRALNQRNLRTELKETSSGSTRRRSAPKMGWCYAAAPGQKLLAMSTWRKWLGAGDTPKTHRHLSLIAWKAAWLSTAPGAMWIVDVRKLLFSSAQQRWGSIWNTMSTHTLPSPIGMSFVIRKCSKEGYQDGHRPTAHDLERARCFSPAKERLSGLVKSYNHLPYWQTTQQGPVNTNCSLVHSR